LNQLFELVKDQDITLEKAIKKSGMNQEKFQQKMNEYFSINR